MGGLGLGHWGTGKGEVIRSAGIRVLTLTLTLTLTLMLIRELRSRQGSGLMLNEVLCRGGVMVMHKGRARDQG